MFFRRIRANGIMAITAKPLGTTNQNRPDRPQLNVIAELIMTAIAQVQTAITDPTPKPKPTLRSAMMKSCVFRTSSVLTPYERAKENKPNPIIDAYPRAGVRVGIAAKIDLSIAITPRVQMVWRRL